MKKLLYSLACISCIAAVQPAAAQAPGIAWKNVYSDYLGYGSCVEQANDGGYIVGGIFASHFLVFKLDNSGAQQWHRWITSGTGITSVMAVKPTTDNGYIVAGSDFAFSADSIGNHGIRDFMVTKLNSSGSPDWIKCLGGTSNEEAQSIEQTSDGGYIVVGYTNSSDGQVTGWHGNSDYWVVKLDASGNISWQKALGGALYDYATSVVQTSDGGYIVAGYAGSKDGDVTGTHWGGSDDDVWVVKLDATGNITWQKSYGGSSEDHAWSIRQASDGGYIVAGSTTSGDGNISGKHGADNQDYWVLKLDATGNLAWQKCLGGTGSGTGAGSGNDIAYSVRQTTDGGYVVGGTVISADSTNDDITGYHGHSGSDYWVVKLDGSGAISWEKSLGGQGTEDARAAVPTSDGGYIVAGTTVYSPDGDVATPYYGDNHPWVVKLGGVTGVEEMTNGFSFALYPNPADNMITISDAPVGSTLRITDVTGTLVYSATISNAIQVVNTSGFANGIYMLQLIDKSAVSNKKFIVNR